ncbi:MAG: NBR1-Ig-like domain-containing protein [Anaerolineales bacterium]
MQLTKKYWQILLVLTFILSACGGAQGDGAEGDGVAADDAALTSAVGTMVASFFATQTAMYTPPSPTSTETVTPSPSPTSFVQPLPVDTATPSITPTRYTFTPGASPTVTVTGTLSTATVNPNLLASGCNNLKFVRDVNYPSGTTVKAGEVFTKTWKVENNGSCNWMFLYRLVFLSGTNMDATTGTLGKQVTPGNWAELSVAVTAPTKPGTYTSSFRFSDGTNMFGATLNVTIKVEGPPTNTPLPTNTSVPPTSTNTTSPTATYTPSVTPTP